MGFLSFRTSYHTYNIITSYINVWKKEKRLDVVKVGCFPAGLGFSHWLTEFLTSLPTFY